MTSNASTERDPCPRPPSGQLYSPMIVCSGAYTCAPHSGEASFVRSFSPVATWKMTPPPLVAGVESAVENDVVGSAASLLPLPLVLSATHTQT